MLIRTLEQQLRQPRGLIGWLVGRGLAVINRPINYWTVDLLELRSDDHVLEVGFGSGVAIRLMSSIVRDGFVAGVDLSEEMVEQASLRNTSAIRRGRVELRRGDASTLPYEDASFDKACAIQGLYYWPEPAAVLKELRRVLKPGGLLAVSVLRKEDVERWRPSGDGFALYSGVEMLTMLREAGFSAVRLEHRRALPRALCALAVK